MNPMCESIIQKNALKSKCYACRPLSAHEIEVVRIPGTVINIEKECSDCLPDVKCTNCSPSSPVTRFTRRRRITCHALGTGHCVVECSCLEHSNSGIPCPHFRRLLKVQPEHVLLRWHRACAALFMRELCERATESFISRRRDRRLVVTCKEYNEMMSEARHCEELHDESVFKQSTFDDGDSHCCQGGDGILPSSPTLITQEIGSPPQLSEADLDTPDFAPHLSGNTHNDLVASLTSLTGACSRNPELMAALCSNFYEMQAKMEGIIEDRLGSVSQRTGDWVSCRPVVGGANRSSRFKSAFKPKRKKKKKNTKKITGPVLTIDSAII